MTLIKDLIDIPDRVYKDEYVLKLSEGVNHPEATLRDYVLTPELKTCFDTALSIIRGAVISAPARPPFCTAASVAARATSWPCST